VALRLSLCGRAGNPLADSPIVSRAQVVRKDACAGAYMGELVTFICKHCGGRGTLTEGESTRIAADLDRRYSLEEQAKITFTGICSECWSSEEEQRILEAARSGRLKVQLVRGSG
jgi:Fe2+ or Zn2+ uptake regulation protein